MKYNKAKTVENAMLPLKNEDTILVGGFGLVGSPLTLINYLTKKNIKDLTIISNNIGEVGKGLGLLLQQDKISKVIGSYFTSNRDVAKYYNADKLDVELLPQGTFSEAIRAGGAGIGGFYTKSSIGTDLAKGKEIKEIDGEEYVFEKALKSDVALIRAWKADTLGNLVYYKTARNFNPIMATAATYVVVEVDEIVEYGELSPEEIVTPHLFVDAVVKSQLVLTNEGVVSV
ncbi:3-oxoacid CoA-transferase subunit A [Oceanobacillus sp. FSL K6-2867]|uniref:CoA transferase subunit A n=1 Tax=Oceanobacillus sp. FSL K6-2867 TaxID=2954748 RepID=UPI0030DD58A7